MKILIVEDELLIQRAIERYLISQGHSVDSTFLGQDAIDKILRQKYDLVFCDLMLKDITGFDVLEASKLVLGAHNLKQNFVLMTAYCSPVILDKAKIYECKILEKPFSTLKILDTFLATKLGLDRECSI